MAQAVAAAAPAQNATSAPSTQPQVTEAMLFERFSNAGPVLSIRVCRDAITRRSLGYAYVNFQQPADAERALDTMNFDMIMNKPIRIMWSQRDPSIRRSGAGNIFIKNLGKDIDTKAIYDTFSMFGSILSCKTEEAANNAIEKVNGMLLDGKKVFVGKFVPRSAREKQIGDAASRFTNVYVKNFGDALDSDKLGEFFAQFGFGFVAFKDHESAAKAVDKLNDLDVPEGKPEQKFTVCRAQKKSERQAELKRRYEQYKAERIQRYQGVNLYVKNLTDTISDEMLRKHFESYGNITSAKVMCDENGRSKGFGFVCFEKADEATKAVVDMNNKIIGNKPLVWLQCACKIRLASWERWAQMRGAVPRWNNMGGFSYMMGPAGGQYAANQVARGPRAGGVGPGGIRGPYGGQPRQQNRMPGMGGQQQGMRYQGVQQGQQVAYSSYPMNHQQQNRGMAPQMGGHGITAHQEPLNTQMLSDAEPTQLLGERLYTLVGRCLRGDCDAEKVGKITGMLLEMENFEILVLLENEDMLRMKVDEATAVLYQAQAQKEAQ
uniref:PABP n=1 Tax=Globodera pallida TaxID=36090 RepID=A0A183BIB0_GLOPA